MNPSTNVSRILVLHLLVFLSVTITLSLSTRPDPDSTESTDTTTEPSDTGGDWTNWTNFTNFGTSFGSTEMVCKEQGPCYMKKLECPDSCYQSVNRQENGVQISGSGGGCTMDCANCEARCVNNNLQR